MPSPPLPDPYLADLQVRGLLPPDQAAAIAAADQARPFSLHYELRALLYLGITSLAGGLGVLVYQNIDSIGHGVIIAVIAALMAACFGYAARHRAPFTWGVAPKTSVGADYLLVLGCLLFVVLEGYVQYQYHVFGNRYGLATAVPALVFIPLAYSFDHRGVLAMGLTALASWVGLTVAPLSVLVDNDFWNEGIQAAAIGLGLVLMAAGFYSEHSGRKAHFAFTYLLLGSNLALAALTAAMLRASVHDDSHAAVFVAALVALALCGGLFWYARRTQSYWFLVLAAAYAYIAVGCIMAQVIMALPDDVIVLSLVVVFPLSALAVVLFFVNLKKIMRGPTGSATPPPPTSPV